MFTQSDNDSWKKNIKCHNCGKNGALSPGILRKKRQERSGAKNKDQMHANVEVGLDEDIGENVFGQNNEIGCQPELSVAG
jgi:hypothetical protein